MIKLAYRPAKRRKILIQAIKDIDKTIDCLHKMTVDFSRNSIYQRIITDLDGARVSARAAIHIEEHSNDIS